MWRSIQSRDPASSTSEAHRHCNCPRGVGNGAADMANDRFRLQAHRSEEDEYADTRHRRAAAHLSAARAKTAIRTRASISVPTAKSALCAGENASFISIWVP